MIEYPSNREEEVVASARVANAYYRLGLASHKRFTDDRLFEQVNSVRRAIETAPVKVSDGTAIINFQPDKRLVLRKRGFRWVVIMEPKDHPEITLTPRQMADAYDRAVDEVIRRLEAGQFARWEDVLLAFTDRVMQLAWPKEWEAAQRMRRETDALIESTVRLGEQIRVNSGDSEQRHFR